MMMSAQFRGVSRWSASGSRTGSLVMRCLLAGDCTGSGPPFFIPSPSGLCPLAKAAVAVASEARAITTASLGCLRPGIAVGDGSVTRLVPGRPHGDACLSAAGLVRSRADPCAQRKRGPGDPWSGLVNQKLIQAHGGLTILLAVGVMGVVDAVQQRERVEPPLVLRIELRPDAMQAVGA